MAVNLNERLIADLERRILSDAIAEKLIAARISKTFTSDAIQAINPSA
jgi:hypothetical protein